MKKMALVILSLVMALTLVIGSVSMVSAAALPRVSGGGFFTQNMTLDAPTGVSFQARQVNAGTEEATGKLTWAIGGKKAGHIIGKVLYLSVSEDGNNAWIGGIVTLASRHAPLPGSEFVIEIQDDTNQISYPDWEQTASDATQQISLKLYDLKGQVTIR